MPRLAERPEAPPTFRAASVGAGHEAIIITNTGTYHVIPLEYDRYGDEDR